MQKKHQQQPKITDHFFLVIKDMFKSLSLSPFSHSLSLSLSHQPPFTPCHTGQPDPHPVHTNTQGRSCIH